MDYSQVDALASKLFGSTGFSSKFKVRVIFERKSLKEYLPFNLVNELNGIARKFESGGGKKRRPPKLEDVLESLAFIVLRDELGIETSGIATSLQSDMRDFIKLVAIPRVRLAFQGKKAVEMYELQPLRPGVRLKVELYRRPGASVNCTEKQLATLALVYTLYFLGLGKASTRGFGKFRLIPQSINVDDCIEKELNLRDMFKNAFRSAEGSKRAFREAGLKLIELGSKVLSHSTTAEKVAEQLDNVNLKLAGVPSLVVAIKHYDVIDRLVHPCPYSTRSLTKKGLKGCKPCGPDGCKQVKDVIGALSAVGKATLKSTWKYVHFTLGVIKTIREPGVAYHTWPLGLPRGVTREGGRFRTGYYLVKSPLLMGEDCDDSLHDLADFKDELRRQSLMFFTVACSSGVCHAIVEPFITYMDFQRMIELLVHVGRHGPTWHVVSVAYAATQKVLGANNCPPDKAGIALPNVKQPFITASDPIEDPVRTTLEWIKYLLS